MMITNHVKEKFTAVLLPTLMLMLLPGLSFALTSSGVVIQNSASVDYEISGVNQTDIVSNTVDFTVDAKVDLTVAGTGGNVNVTPGASGQVLRFTVDNTGNETFDFSLSFTADAGDNFDAASVAVYVDVNGDNAYQAGTDTATSINDLAPGDAPISVFVVGNIPLSATDAQIATYHLVATALLADGSAIPAEAASDTEDSKDYVYADGAGSDASDSTRDKKHSASLNYVAQTATLSVTKSSVLISDPINGTGAAKTHIPGAVVEYTITISNTGTAQADAIVLTDTLDANLIIASDGNNYAAGKSIRITAPNLYSGAATALTNASGDDEATVTGNTVSVTGIVLTNGQSATVEIRAEIQ